MTIAQKELWLNYFNDYLYKKDAITELSYNKMREAIREECKHKKVGHNSNTKTNTA